MRLQDRVVIITGGGRGIGAATAQVIAGEGGKVVIGDMLEAEGEATAAAIRAAGGDAVFVRTDITKEADCVRLAATAAERTRVASGIVALGPSGIAEICRCQQAVAVPSTCTGFCGSVLARSLRTSTKAPAPSVTRQQSRTVSGLAIMLPASRSPW